MTLFDCIVMIYGAIGFASGAIFVLANTKDVVENPGICPSMSDFDVLLTLCLLWPIFAIGAAFNTYQWLFQLYRRSGWRGGEK